MLTSSSHVPVHCVQLCENPHAVARHESTNTTHLSTCLIRGARGVDRRSSCGSRGVQGDVLLIAMPREEPEGRALKEVELSGAAAHAKLQELIGGMTVNGGADKEYRFWSTQPVPQMDDGVDAGDGEPIEVKTVEDVRKEGYPLIAGFEWCDVDVNDDAQLEEAYRLLNENYVEDNDAMFRFDYSRDFLRWALLPPGWHASWHVGVRVMSNKKLVAFITAVPATVLIHATPNSMVEINFLCVHKKLRSKRLAPVLIREITRRVNLKGVWQAVYTAGALLPRPMSSSRYYHRSLNPKKLIDVGFSRLAPRMTMTRTIKFYALKAETAVPGIRPLTPEDVPAACKLLADYMSKSLLHVRMTEEEFAHWLLPRDGVIYTYVVENPESKQITDLVSFYSLPSSIIRHRTHRTLNAAYVFCIAAVQTPITELMGDALILARQNDFDVFNALDLFHNSEFFKELRFHIGDGKLHYYLYNWKCRPIDSGDNALVLL